jgi:YVTN family beta-propeller protein
VLGTFSVGDGAAGLAADGGSIWVANNGSSTVTRLDRATGAVIGTYASGRGPFGIAFDGRNMWVANFAGSSISTTLSR